MLVGALGEAAGKEMRHLVDLHIHVVQVTDRVLHQFLLRTVLAEADSQQT